jgi:hypothetical protein
VNLGVGGFTAASYFDAEKDACVAPPKFSKKT